MAKTSWQQRREKLLSEAGMHAMNVQRHRDFSDENALAARQATEKLVAEGGQCWNLIISSVEASRTLPKSFVNALTLHRRSLFEAAELLNRPTSFVTKGDLLKARKAAALATLLPDLKKGRGKKAESVLSPPAWELAIVDRFAHHDPIALSEIAVLLRKYHQAAIKSQEEGDSALERIRNAVIRHHDAEKEKPGFTLGQLFHQIEITEKSVDEHVNFGAGGNEYYLRELVANVDLLKKAH